MSHQPIREVPMYQAQCTSCGALEDDYYGEYSGLCDAKEAIDYVTSECGWWAPDQSSPTDFPPSELLCPACQKCHVCGAGRCYPHDDGKHAVCEQHEDHDFSAVTA